MHPSGPVKQRGASLLLAVLLMALFSGLVVHALQANQWQRRIATHEIGLARAEAAALSALRWAEQWLMHLPGEAPPACIDACGLRPETLRTAPDALAGLDPVLALPESWWLEHAHADGFDPGTGRLLEARGASGTPTGRWIVIPLDHPDAPRRLDDGVQIHFYRILARAVPNRQGEPILIETVMARPWGDASWRDSLPADGTPFCATAGAPQPCGRLRWQQRP
jgi:hypothetical protein